MSSDEIVVSVTLLAYKHAKYIRQCLDSILAQKVNFKYEIIVGDDCSEDGTEEILEEYKAKYPDIIIPAVSKHNLGASKNSFRLKQLCRGKYILGSESDDFLIDDKMLQKQVDYLENHSDCIGVGTNFTNVDPDGNNPYISMLSWQVDKKYFLKDFLRYGMTIHGNTILYRNILPTSGEKYEKLRFAAPSMGDIISRVLMYDKGYIYVLPDVCHAHREGSKDKTSFFSNQSTKAIEYCYMYCTIVDATEEYFENKYNLQKLKANRTGGVILKSFVGDYKVNRDEFREYMKTLPLNIRLLSYERFLQKGARAIAHKVGRKLNMFYKIK